MDQTTEIMSIASNYECMAAVKKLQNYAELDISNPNTFP